MPCYRICKVDSDDNGMIEARKWWEAWDLRILVLYMFISQLYLLIFGRLRRKNASPLMMIVSVWLIYLFADLLATIALGKLTKIKVDEKDNGRYALRVMWAPLILFYLGGPDTLTVLRAEENKLWVRHLIGLLTQGVRAAYVLIVTWNPEDKLSLLALLVFVPGIMKYGERVWVVKSRSEGNYEGFVHQLDLSTIDKISASRPNAKLVLQAYSWLQALMPHNPAYKCDPSSVSSLVTKFHASVREGTIDAFKLTEIELGLIYDMLFSKVGTIFTLWGSILRFLSFSLIFSVLVIFLKCYKPPKNVKGDHPITIILLAGAIFLDIAGVVVQLVSDWAMVWACKNLHPVVTTSSFNVQDTGLSPIRDSSSKWATSVLFLHEYLISKRQRWSGVIGQFSLRDFRTKYKPTMCNNTWERVFSRQKMLKRFSSQLSPPQHLKDLIINHLCKKLEEVDTLQTPTKRPTNVGTSQASIQKIASDDNFGTSTDKNADVSTSQTSTGKIVDVDTVPPSTENKLPILVVTRAGWTLSRYNPVPELKWSIDLEFDQSIVIWHFATQVCYNSDHPKIVGKDEEKLKAVKILSDYMMYLLVACPDTFPFCNNYDKITKELFGEGSTSSNSKGVERLVNEAQKLVEALERNPKRWEIMGGVWVEMLCYAAQKCPMKNHIQELRHGGEFLTHVWLLLMHFVVPKIMERSGSNLKDELDGGARNTGPAAEDIRKEAEDSNKVGMCAQCFCIS